MWEVGLGGGKLREVSTPGPACAEEEQCEMKWDSVRGSVTYPPRSHGVSQVTSENHRKDLGQGGADLERRNRASVHMGDPSSALDCSFHVRACAQC